MTDLTNFDRRKTIKREDGVTISYSIPAGVTDEAAAAEVAKAERQIARGYSYKARFHDAGLRINIKWLVRQPAWLQWSARMAQRISRLGRVPLTLWDETLFWFKSRWLDAYWFVKDRVSPERGPKHVIDGKENA